MDMRSKLLALAVFGVFAVALFSVTYALWQAVQGTQHQLSQLLPAELPRDQAERPARNQPPKPDEYSNPRVDILRTQVERLNGRLNRLSELLEAKTAEYNDLKADFDQNAEVLRELLASEPPPARNAESTEPKPEVKTSAGDATIEELNSMLREVRAEVAALEKEAALDELQILEMEDRKRALEAAASTALVRSGAGAVSAIADLLSHRNPEIRRWAATLLGEIGPDASPAWDSLQEALSDADEDVRTAARKAMRRIDKP